MLAVAYATRAEKYGAADRSLHGGMILDRSVDPLSPTWIDEAIDESYRCDGPSQQWDN
ncbi:hypothetical protein RISK_001275 [Rhodopirellula islandica]|uniref:Uncharacterized protein n=1 Tax=Rhodopirellula islandica TaxID=595434 RepID=A0A0J1BJH2_RHOIS|nr:hypothetical protein RISK_001275 [Rhodopirellula islandica]